MPMTTCFYAKHELSFLFYSSFRSVNGFEFSISHLQGRLEQWASTQQSKVTASTYSFPPPTQVRQPAQKIKKGAEGMSADCLVPPEVDCWFLLIHRSVSRLLSQVGSGDK
ncbi:hypothetical protein CEXT_402881 [Caerostris extrusa]|uniref:Uncharacterized protein n=1 Tax=Caerostris extrusa TaxID=172846 RepID=A0AAV4QNW7_CAEEX|nr:hypothetical protein CEXT_402881 [Caerostris extrusa]